MIWHLYNLAYLAIFLSIFHLRENTLISSLTTKFLYIRMINILKRSYAYAAPRGLFHMYII